MLAPKSCLFILIVAPVILALSATEIIDSLNTLTGQANQTTLVLDEILAQIGDEQLNVLESRGLLDETTTAYLNFADSMAENPGSVVWDETVSALVFQSADLHSRTFSIMGIALAESLPAFNKYGFYVDACDDGVEIGLHAIALFTNLALKFPRENIALLLDGLFTNLRVPLADPLAAECFAPLLGHLALRPGIHQLRQTQSQTRRQ
ncbi:hypothetical protein DFH07DRAFT_943468 [Mycena maculata]|uniref:Uncharacterized protein n=1 Tax=Mycena maculata TaxID=230809 RepID=A0AAD7IH23_9AGAR|nr:hypothetical protein DFH07DRAFT_943468 [Mycena maculata]